MADDVQPDPVETLKQAAPASFRGAIDSEAMWLPPKKIDLSSFKWGDPIKPKPATEITAEFIAQVVTERDGLRKRVTDLLNANNGLVQERRDLALRLRVAENEVEEMRSSFERSQDDLATLRAEADERLQAMMSPPPTQAVPDHLTITITGPQGCGKTLLATRFRHAFKMWGAEVEGDLEVDREERNRAIRDLVAGKPVTIIDIETPPPAPDVVAEEAPEYVFGPWVTPEDNRAPLFTTRCHYNIGSTRSDYINARIFPPDAEPTGCQRTRYRRAYRIGEWHPHHPGEMPVSDDTQVQVCTRTGDIQPAARADEFEWEDLATGVIAFRPVAVVAEVDVYFVPRAEAAE